MGIVNLCLLVLCTKVALALEREDSVSFIVLYCRSGEERDEWIAALTSSIEEHKKRQHSFLPQAAQQVSALPISEAMQN